MRDLSSRPDERELVKEGDVVFAQWFDDPTYYTGKVKHDEEGLYIDTPDGVGYLKEAHHVVKRYATPS